MDCASAGAQEVEAVKGQQVTMRSLAESVNRTVELAFYVDPWLDGAMKALVISGPPAIGKSTIAERLTNGSTLRAIIEVDELRTQALRIGTPGKHEQAEDSDQSLQDTAATKAAIQIARVLLERGVQVIIPDHLGSEHADLYRNGLSAVLVVQLDANPGAHRVRNRARPRPRRYAPALLDFLHANARQSGSPDLVLDTTGTKPDDTAQHLETLLRS